MKPTVILVHGAYAESSSWNGVAEPLLAAGHRVIAFPNPLRGVASDAALLSDLLRSVDGPVVLVGHSYGGAVMTNVDATAAGAVVAAVYIAGFALAIDDHDWAGVTSCLADIVRRDYHSLTGAAPDDIARDDRARVDHDHDHGATGTGRGHRSRPAVHVRGGLRRWHADVPRGQPRRGSSRCDRAQR